MFTMLMCRDIEQQNYMYKSTTKFSNRNKMAITCLSNRTCSPLQNMQQYCEKLVNYTKITKPTVHGYEQR